MWLLSPIGEKDQPNIHNTLYRIVAKITYHSQKELRCRCGLGVERLIRNQQGVGSNPTSGYHLKNASRDHTAEGK